VKYFDWKVMKEFVFDGVMVLAVVNEGMDEIL